jgi:hypothetical protein
VERSRAGLAGLIAVSAFLLWRIVAVNFGDFDAGGRPRGAASETLADLVAALKRNPADVRALLALARNDSLAGKPGNADAQLEAARRIAPRDQAVWELQAIDLVRRGQIAEAASVLSRITTTFGAYERTFPVFAQLLAARDPSFDAVASSSPPWLGHFILVECGKGMDPLLLAPFVQLRVADGRGAQEVECVIDRLRAAGHWTTAYQVWLNALPRPALEDVGFIFNGSFENAATSKGFDWRPDAAPERESGHSAQFAPSRDRAHALALRVVYTGKRQAVAAIGQFLAVPPGRYELTGRVWVDALTSPRGVQWTVRCAADPANVLLASSEAFRGTVPWRDFNFAVDIAGNCAGQVLALEPVGMNEGTTFVSGSIWFDDLVLSVRR